MNTLQMLEKIEAATAEIINSEFPAPPGLSDSQAENRQSCINRVALETARVAVEKFGVYRWNRWLVDNQ